MYTSWKGTEFLPVLSSNCSRKHVMNRRTLLTYKTYGLIHHRESHNLKRCYSGCSVHGNAKHLAKHKVGLTHIVYKTGIRRTDTTKDRLIQHKELSVRTSQSVYRTEWQASPQENHKNLFLSFISRQAGMQTSRKRSAVFSVKKGCISCPQIVAYHVTGE